MRPDLLRRLLTTLSMVLPLLVSVPALAQNKDSQGEFGAVEVRFGKVRNSGSTFIGGRGGWIVDQDYSIGIGGCLLMNDVAARTPDTSRDDRLMISYGGLDLEYRHSIGDFLFLTAQTLIGGGAVGHVENVYLNPRPHYDPFFVVEPGVVLGVSLSRIFDLSAGASYRFAGLLTSDAASNNDLTGPHFTISIEARVF